MKPEPKLAQKPCCTASRAQESQIKSAGSDRLASVTYDSEMRAQYSIREKAIAVPGGRGFLGTNNPCMEFDGEAPLRRKTIKPFLMSPTTVTNAQFQIFITQTGYVTEAETYGWSFVFWAQVPKSIGPTQGLPGAQWWRRVDGANWRDIHGPGTQEESFHPDHPVVHVSWNDARAYANWAGGRLPTETEWEHAARGGQGDVAYPWGDKEPDDRNHFPCNIWQGPFPEHNLGHDGYVTTAPAQSFAPNGYGLYNMVGNVWEWSCDPFTNRSQKRAAKEQLALMKGYKLIKGGSFLCHKSYCYRYRIAARTGNSPDSTTTHTSFRVVWS